MDGQRTPDNLLYAFLHDPSERAYTAQLLSQDLKADDGWNSDVGHLCARPTHGQSSGSGVCGWRKPETRETGSCPRKSRHRRGVGVVDRLAGCAAGGFYPPVLGRPPPECFVFRHYEDPSQYSTQYRYYHTVDNTGRTGVQFIPEIQTVETESDRLNGRELTSKIGANPTDHKLPRILNSAASASIAVSAPLPVQDPSMAAVSARLPGLARSSVPRSITPVFMLSTALSKNRVTLTQQQFQRFCQQRAQEMEESWSGKKDNCCEEQRDAASGNRSDVPSFFRDRKFGCDVRSESDAAADEIVNDRTSRHSCVIDSNISGRLVKGKQTDECYISSEMSSRPSRRDSLDTGKDVIISQQVNSQQPNVWQNSDIRGDSNQDKESETESSPRSVVGNVTQKPRDTEFSDGSKSIRSTDINEITEYPDLQHCKDFVSDNKKDIDGGLSSEDVDYADSQKLQKSNEELNKRLLKTSSEISSTGGENKNSELINTNRIVRDTEIRSQRPQSELCPVDKALTSGSSKPRKMFEKGSVKGGSQSARDELSKSNKIKKFDRKQEADRSLLRDIKLDKISSSRSLSRRNSVKGLGPCGACYLCAHGALCEKHLKRWPTSPQILTLSRQHAVHRINALTTLKAPLECNNTVCSSSSLKKSPDKELIKKVRTAKLVSKEGHACRVLDTITVGAQLSPDGSENVFNGRRPSTVGISMLQHQAGSAFLIHPTLLLKLKNKAAYEPDKRKMGVQSPCKLTPQSGRVFSINQKEADRNPNVPSEERSSCQETDAQSKQDYRSSSRNVIFQGDTKSTAVSMRAQKKTVSDLGGYQNQPIFTDQQSSDVFGQNPTCKVERDPSNFTGKTSYYLTDCVVLTPFRINVKTAASTLRCSSCGQCRVSEGKASSNELSDHHSFFSAAPDSSCDTLPCQDVTKAECSDSLPVTSGCAETSGKQGLCPAVDQPRPPPVREDGDACCEDGKQSDCRCPPASHKLEWIVSTTELVDVKTVRETKSTPSQRGTVTTIRHDDPNNKWKLQGRCLTYDSPLKGHTHKTGTSEDKEDLEAVPDTGGCLLQGTSDAAEDRDTHHRHNSPETLSLGICGGLSTGSKESQLDGSQRTSSSMTSCGCDSAVKRVSQSTDNDRVPSEVLLELSDRGRQHCQHGLQSASLETLAHTSTGSSSLAQHKLSPPDCNRHQSSLALTPYSTQRGTGTNLVSDRTVIPASLADVLNFNVLSLKKSAGADDTRLETDALGKTEGIIAEKDTGFGDFPPAPHQFAFGKAGLLETERVNEESRRKSDDKGCNELCTGRDKKNVSRGVHFKSGQTSLSRKKSKAKGKCRSQLTGWSVVPDSRSSHKRPYKQSVVGTRASFCRTLGDVRASAGPLPLANVALRDNVVVETLQHLPGRPRSVANPASSGFLSSASRERLPTPFTPILQRKREVCLRLRSSLSRPGSVMKNSLDTAVGNSAPPGPALDRLYRAHSSHTLGNSDSDTRPVMLLRSASTPRAGVGLLSDHNSGSVELSSGEMSASIQTRTVCSARELLQRLPHVTLDNTKSRLNRAQGADSVGLPDEDRCTVPVDKHVQIHTHASHTLYADGSDHSKLSNQKAVCGIIEHNYLVGSESGIVWTRGDDHQKIGQDTTGVDENHSMDDNRQGDSTSRDHSCHRQQSRHGQSDLLLVDKCYKQNLSYSDYCQNPEASQLERKMSQRSLCHQESSTHTDTNTHTSPEPSSNGPERTFSECNLSESASQGHLGLSNKQRKHIRADCRHREKYHPHRDTISDGKKKTPRPGQDKFRASCILGLSQKTSGKRWGSEGQDPGSVYTAPSLHLQRHKTYHQLHCLKNKNSASSGEEEFSKATETKNCNTPNLKMRSNGLNESRDTETKHSRVKRGKHPEMLTDTQTKWRRKRVVGEDTKCPYHQHNSRNRHINGLSKPMACLHSVSTSLQDSCGDWKQADKTTTKFESWPRQLSTSLQLHFSVLRTSAGDCWLDLFRHRPTVAHMADNDDISDRENRQKSEVENSLSKQCSDWDAKEDTAKD